MHPEYDPKHYGGVLAASSLTCFVMDHFLHCYSTYFRFTSKTSRPKIHLSRPSIMIATRLILQMRCNRSTFLPQPSPCHSSLSSSTVGGGQVLTQQRATGSHTCHVTQAAGNLAPSRWALSRRRSRFRGEHATGLGLFRDGNLALLLPPFTDED